MTTRPVARDRSDFIHWASVQTRWLDNDAYGHVNNVVYYAYFDSVVNRYLIDRGGLDIQTAPIIGIVVESGCRFHASFAYPGAIEAGLVVGKIGTSSVRYELGLFAPGEAVARADGFFVHVFVDRKTQRPLPIPDDIRLALTALVRT